MANAVARAGALALILALLGTSGCAGGSVARAEEEVNRFHRRYDRALFDESYAAASPQFRSSTPKKRFVEMQHWVRRELGEVKSTERIKVVQQSGASGWKAGLVYRTTFERGQGIEEFSFGIDQGVPRLTGYYIESEQLPLDAAPR